VWLVIGLSLLDFIRPNGTHFYCFCDRYLNAPTLYVELIAEVVRTYHCKMERGQRNCLTLWKQFAMEQLLKQHQGSMTFHQKLWGVIGMERSPNLEKLNLAAYRLCSLSNSRNFWLIKLNHWRKGCVALRLRTFVVWSCAEDGSPEPAFCKWIQHCWLRLAEWLSGQTSLSGCSNAWGDQY